MASPRDVLRSGLNLMRRLPPRDVQKNISLLTALRPEAGEEFLQRVDQPLETKTDATTGRKYLLCDYNREEDSYRSPWSNTYDPPVADAFYPTAELRAMEVEANEVFDVYRTLYYEASNSISSVYMWGLEKGFAGCWLIKKEIGSSRFLESGCWDSIHVIEVTPFAAAASEGTVPSSGNSSSSSASSASGASGGKTWQYKLTSTVLLKIIVDRPETTGKVDLSGSLTRQAALQASTSIEKGHVAIMGGMIETMERDMRGGMDALYISKTREILSTMHAPGGGMTGPSPKSFMADLSAAVTKKGGGVATFAASAANSAIAASNAGEK